MTQHDNSSLVILFILSYLGSEVYRTGGPSLLLSGRKSISSRTLKIKKRSLA